MSHFEWLKMNNPALRGVELTLCILKPHVLAAPHVLKAIQQIIEHSGFSVVKSKIGNISPQEANAFYGEHAGKFFYNRLITFMCSGPCGFYVLAKENAIEDWRKLLGPTKVYQTQFTHPGTIRGTFGLTDTRNAAHGSDSVTSAVREINVFFPEFDVGNWGRQNEPAESQ